MIGCTAAGSDAVMSGLRAAIDADGGGRVQIYSGSRPTTPGAAGGVLLASIELATPCGSVSGGDLELSPTGEAQLVAGGTPAWARLVSGSGTALLDCGARLLGAPDEGEELVIAATALSAGAFVRIVSGAFTARP